MKEIHSATHSSLTKIEFFRKPEGAKTKQVETTTDWRGSDHDVHVGTNSRECKRDTSRPIYKGMTSAYDFFPFLKK